MSLADLARSNPSVTAIVAVIILVASLAVIFKPRTRAIPEQWFYDVADGQLFAHPGSELPPVNAPSGGEGVLAHVYTCGDCADDTRRQVGYLVKYQSATTPAPDNTLVALPSATLNWVSIDTPQGVAVVETVNEMRARCRQTFQECLPRP